MVLPNLCSKGVTWYKMSASIIVTDIHALEIMRQTFRKIAYLTNPGHSFFPIFQGVLCYLFTMLLKQLPSNMRDPIQFS